MSTTTTDPIADMLTRIRNAIAARKNEVSVPHSKIKESVAKLLCDNNFIDDVAVDKATVGKIIRINLNPQNSAARITEIERISTPGRRHYASAAEIPKVKQGRGIVIVSTSKGLMTGTDAQKSKIGGELICKVY